MPIPSNSEEKLARYLADGGWDIYDGVPIQHDATLDVCSIVLSISLNSRLNTWKQVWQVWKGRHRVEDALARIPSNASLEDSDIPWQALSDLYNGMCAISDVAGAKATKILHKKRPSLVPIFDSILEGYWKTRIRGWSSMTWGQGLLAYTKEFRQELLSNQERLHGLCLYTASKGWAITPVRALEVLTWIEIEPNGEYR